MTPEEFNSRFLPYAQAVSARTGLDPRLVLAQAALETGYGKSAPNMNYFGIKSHGRAGGQTLQTSEFENGRMVGQPASFRAYDSPEQSFQGYADFLLTNPRYKGVLAADGLENQIAEMAKSGYATDPNYGAKLASIAGVAGGNDMLTGGGGSMSLLGGGGNDTGGGLAMENDQGGLFGFLGDREQRARLGLALMGMSMHPNEGAMAMARDTIAQAQAARENQFAQAETAKAENRTLEYIANLGTPQAQRALAYAQGTGDVAGALRMAMETAEPERGVVVGGSIVNPLTGEVIYQPEDKPEFRRATAEEAAAYGVQAGQFGPDGRFYEIDVPQGMVMESDGQGGFTFRQGAGVGGVDARPPTEGQLAGAGMLQRMTGAEEILRAVERETGMVAIPIEKTFLMGTQFEGITLTPTEQRLAQAQRDWVRAKLRKESGAVIGADEMAAEILTYFPQVGEGPEVVAQKAEARRRAEEQLKIGAGSAAGQAGIMSPAYSPPIRADDLMRAGIGSGTPTTGGWQPVEIGGVSIQRVK